MIIALPLFVKLIDNYMSISIGMSPLNIEGESVAVPIGPSIFHTVFIISITLLRGDKKIVNYYIKEPLLFGFQI